MSLAQKLLRVAGNTGTDSEWDQVVLSMHGDVSGPFIDEKGHTVTANGDASLSTSTKRFGAGSIYLDGTGDYLSIPASNDWNFNTGAFCIEGWFKRSNATTGGAFATATTYSGVGNGFQIFVYPSNVTFWAYNNDGGAQRYRAIGSDTNWHHLAVFSDGLTGVYIAHDGKIVKAGGVVTVGDSGVELRFGRDWGANEGYFPGYLDDLRITKGVSRYDPTAFVGESDPHWANVVLMMDMEGNNGEINARFHDCSGKVVTNTGGTTYSSAEKKYGNTCAYFDGTADYLTLDGSTDFAFGTGDFTIEFWIKFNDVSSNQIIYDSRVLDGPYPVIYLSGGVFRYYVNGADRITGTTSMSLSTWVHVELSRASGNTKLFVNGVQDGSTFADSNNYSIAANRPAIGTNGLSLGLTCLAGYLDDLRVTKGVARHSADFTPPTAALPVPSFTPPTKANADYGRPVDPYWSNVVLAMHMDGRDNGTVFHDEKGKTVTAYGNVKTVTATKKFGNSSAYFDGTGDYLSTPYTTDWNFSGRPAFTIDFWVKRNDPTSDFPIINSAYFNTIGDGWKVNSTATGISFTAFNGDSGTVFTKPWSPDTEWHFITICGSGGNIYIGIDGNVTNTGSYVNISGSGDDTKIGREYGSSTSYFNGYLDDIRVTLNIARYTSNFSIPTRAFPRA